MARRMRFITWAKKDPDDNTKIAYTFRKRNQDGTKDTIYFTSEDLVSWDLFFRIREAWVESVELKQEEAEAVWNVVIYED